jgi:hypothetical protein
VHREAFNSPPSATTLLLPPRALRARQYLAVRSASERLKPDTIFLHYTYIPSGLWFDRALPLLTLHQVDPVTEVFGNRLDHVAHRADVLRLQLLRDQGGIYMDLDVISIAPFSPDLTQADFTMGMEGHSGVTDAEFVHAYGRRHVLCNAVMVAKPGARFIEHWMDYYRRPQTFDSKKNWAAASVVVPAMIARKHPEDVNVVGPRTFFYPLWTRPGLNKLFEPSHADPLLFDGDSGGSGGSGGSSTVAGDSADKAAAAAAAADDSGGKAYAVHLWDKVSYGPYTKDLTVRQIMEVDTSFHMLVRPFVRDLYLAERKDQGRSKEAVPRGEEAPSPGTTHHSQDTGGSGTPDDDVGAVKSDAAVGDVLGSGRVGATNKAATTESNPDELTLADVFGDEL